MSCVPSINAYVATQTCHQNQDEEKTKKEISNNNEIKNPQKIESIEKKKSWLGNIMERFSFVGHDGVTFVGSTTPNNNQSPEEKIKIVDRVRHLSECSTTSEGTTSPELHSFSPER